MLDDKVILVTGGTGSFGRCFAERVLAHHRPRQLIVFSRDEQRQYAMSRDLGPDRHPCLRYVLGDVRDRDRLRRVFEGVDVVVHAAALKHVPITEDHPMEAVHTNILGTANVIDAALDRKIGVVIGLSTDKAAGPVSLYGATKLCAERLLASANRESRMAATRFAAVRFGNFQGSSGSVLPLFLRLRATGTLPVTDRRMSRFWVTLPQAVDFLLSCLERMRGGEVFVPKLPSVRIVDLANAVAPDCRLRFVGRRPGEKLHEVLITRNDAPRTLEYDDRFIIRPPSPHPTDGRNGDRDHLHGRPCPKGFQFRSDRNSHRLDGDELRAMLVGLDGERVAGAVDGMQGSAKA